MFVPDVGWMLVTLVGALLSGEDDAIGILPDGTGVELQPTMNASTVTTVRRAATVRRTSEG